MEEFEKDVAFSTGLLQEWAKDAPKPIRDAISIIARGVTFYRDQAFAERAKLVESNNKLNELSILSAGYLSKLQQQDEQLVERDIEEQRDVHQKIDEALGNRRRARGFVDID